MTYRHEVRVRGYELDAYQHVNHAVYLNYLEDARWHMMEEAGFTLESYKKWQRWPVVAGVEIDYLKPAFLSDRLTIETEIEGSSKAFFTISQKIRRGDMPIARAKVRVAVVDEKGKLASVPDELKKLLPKEVQP